MKYPYITIDQRKPVLIYKDRRGIYMVDKNDTLSGLDITYVKEQKNQTAKVLANTYGEVKSKEHAEFIVKLAEVAKCAGLEVAKHKIANAKSFKGIFFNFYNDNETLWFAFHYEIQAKTRGEKQITIPLPPECESVDEWPKVNDDVFYNGQKWTFVAKHNDMAMLFWTGDEYCTAKISELQKPKTPEEEFRDSIELIIKESLDEDYSPSANAEHITSEIFGKYNVTKKPQ